MQASHCPGVDPRWTQEYRNLALRGVHVDIFMQASHCAKVDPRLTHEYVPSAAPLGFFFWYAKDFRWYHTILKLIPDGHSNISLWQPLQEIFCMPIIPEGAAEDMYSCVHRGLISGQCVTATLQLKHAALRLHQYGSGTGRSN